jgi:hypothetical protein
LSLKPADDRRVDVPSSAVDGVVERSEEPRQEAIDLIPAGVRSWWAALAPRLTGPDRAAIVIALGQVPLLLLVLVPGSLYLDDLRAQAYVAGRSWWPYVIESNGTHLAPVTRSIDWLHVQVAPLAQWPAVTLTLIIRVGLALAVWRLLREVFGPRTALLVPLSLLVLTPALLPPTAWYRQAISALLVVIALCIATQQHLRHLRTGDARNLLGAVLAVTLGVLTFEKGALIAPWLVILTAAAAPAAERGRDRLRRVWRAKVPLGLYAVVTAGYLAIYLSGPFDKGSAGELHTRDVLSMMGRQLSEGLLPGLMGGPWSWRETSPYYSVPSPPTALIVAALILTAMAMVWCLRRNASRTLWAAVAFACYYLPASGMVAAGRLSNFGDVVGLDYRLWPDTAVVALFCACLASISVRGEQESPLRSGGRIARVSLGVVLTAAVVIGSVVSSVAFVERWVENPTGNYLRTLEAQLREAGSTPVRLAPVGLPSTVLPFWVDPDYSLEDLLAPREGLATFHNIDGPVLVPDDSGRLAPLKLHQRSAADPGPDGFCGYGVRPAQSREIPLPAESPYYADEMVHLGVLASRATTLRVSVVSDSATRSVVTRKPLATTAGPHRFLARVPYDTRVSAIRVRATDPLATVCVVLAALVVPEENP